MRIGINAHLLSNSRSYRNAGISMYIRHLLMYLPEVAEADEFRVFTNASPEETGLSNRMRHMPARWPTHIPHARIAWEQMALPLGAKLSGIDILHSPMHVLPAICPVPSVVTVLDLTFMRFPHTFPKLQRTYLETSTRRAVRKADAVITISESTRRDVIETFGVSPSRVTATPLGVDGLFAPASSDAVERIRSRYGMGDRSALYVGTLEPRKNVPTLLTAFSRVRKELGSDCTLILAGGKGWFYDQIFALIEDLGLSDCVRFTGYVSREDLPALYSAAGVFVYPSLYEGFGLPPLEAMACGTPVVTSNTSSLPEVVGDAGIMVDPNDAAGLALEMLRVLKDPELRRELGEKGLLRAARFSWEETAKATLKIYHDVNKRINDSQVIR